MVLRPQDVVVALKLALRHEQKSTYTLLSHELFLSLSEVHTAVKRLRQARLVDLRRAVNRRALHEFLVHGVRYAFPAVRGTITIGLPTGYAAPPLCGEIVQSTDPPPVWPHPEGPVRGYELPPLMRKAVEASKKDESLYESLALVDGIRDGRARERNLAERFLAERLRVSPPS